MKKREPKERLVAGRSGIFRLIQLLKQVSQSGHYLTALTFGVVVSYMFYYSFPEDSALRQEDQVWNKLDIIPLFLLLAFVACSALTVALLWLRKTPRDRMSRPIRIVLLLVLFSWTLAASLSVWRQEVVSPLILAIPAVVLMILVRPPIPQDVLLATKVWIGAMVLLVWAFLVFEALGVVEGSNHNYSLRQDFIALPWFIDGRWNGPFSGFGTAGIAGAAVAVYGSQQARFLRVGLIATGAFVCLLAESRVAIAAMILGFLASFFVKIISSKDKKRRLMSGFGVLVFIVILLGLISFFSTNSGNGRGAIWSSWFDAISINPAFGLGYAGVNLGLSGGHAHNFLLDTTVRYGLLTALPLLLAATIFLLAVVVRFVSVPKFLLPLLTITAVAGIFDLGPEILYLRLETIPLLLLATMAEVRPEPFREGKENSRSGYRRLAAFLKPAYKNLL